MRWEKIIAHNGSIICVRWGFEPLNLILKTNHNNMQKDNLKHENPTDANNVLAPVFTYLFSFKYWRYDPPRYILVYAKNEEEARIIGAKQCCFNSGQIASPKDLELCTYGL